jgi:hypothetical protein
MKKADRAGSTAHLCSANLAQLVYGWLCLSTKTDTVLHAGSVKHHLLRVMCAARRTVAEIALTITMIWTLTGTLPGLRRVTRSMRIALELHATLPWMRFDSRPALDRRDTCTSSVRYGLQVRRFEISAVAIMEVRRRSISEGVDESVRAYTCGSTVK